MASKTAGNYKRILNLLQKWPVDKTKTGRDLGTFLKNSIRKKEGKLEENQEFWDRQYLSIQRIINNDHFNKYPRTLSSSATGLTPEQCNLILSNEFLKQLQEEEQSLFRKLFSFKTDSVKNEASKDNA